MHFGSDNWSGCHPAISANLDRHASGFAKAYGASDLDKRVEKLFNDIFEKDVAVFFVGTGTAANSLALAALNRPGGVSFCHREAHMIEDECGAPEYFTGGARLHPVDGKLGKIDPALLTRELNRFPPDFVHAGQPMAISITQATEAGTVYTPDEISAIAAVADKHGLPLHMDGARFANALAATGLTPAEMTWKSGVDALSFGATKNGCWCAEALVFFDSSAARDLPYVRKRAAQLFSKTRFIAAQFEAYLDHGLWLELASHANSMTARLSEAIENSSKCRLVWKADANELFPVMKISEMERLQEHGAVFYPWNPPHGLENEIAQDEVMTRFVTSFATTRDDIDRFAILLS